MAESSNSIDWRLILVAAFATISLPAVFLLDPVPQDLAYHLFADTRPLLGIPNSLDVLSNIPFLLVGAYGVFALQGMERTRWHPAWVVFFVGVFLVGFGSAYYHLMPDNNTLVWDRLPMTIGFMGLFIALLAEFSGLKLGYGSIVAAVIVGASSVAYWAVFDDLRFYAWVQFMPLAVVVILLATYGSRFTHTGLLGFALIFYVLAKLFEHFDNEVFTALGGTVSGHSLKHLLAAAGCYTLLLFLQQRVLQR